MHLWNALIIATASLINIASSQGATQPPYDPSALLSVGQLTNPTLSSPTNPLSGGSFTLNGQQFTVPDNLLVDLPTQSLSWSDFTSRAPGGSGVEVQVQANRVAGGLVAGIVSISFDPTQFTTGFISYIDYATGHFRINGGPGDPATGQEVVMNDPLGRYGRPTTGAGPLWVVDSDNPSIGAITGYPLCIPRSDPNLTDDPDCPSKNRPKDAAGKFQAIFTMPVPPAPGTTTLPSGPPDSTKQAPLQIGDYVTLSGPTVNGILSAFSITANLGIYTAPGTKPVYVVINRAAFGLGGDQFNPNLDVGETRIEGFTTDPTGSVSLFALDVDHCTGVTTQRSLITVNPVVGPAGMKGRWRWLAGKIIITPSRQVFATHISGTMNAANGLVAGQFTLPVAFGGIIFPGLMPIASPFLPVRFDWCPWLKDGGGPYTPLAGGKGGVVGQLAQWPGASAPAVAAPAVCPAAQPPAPAAPAAGSPAPASPAAQPPKDTVTITQASSIKGKQAQFTVTIRATSSSSATGGTPAVLTAKLSSPNAGPITMTLSGGVYLATFSIIGKTAATTALVTSSLGGTASRAVI